MSRLLSTVLSQGMSCNTICTLSVSIFVPRLHDNISPMYVRVCVHLGEQYNKEVLGQNRLKRGCER